MLAEKPLLLLMAKNTNWIIKKLYTLERVQKKFFESATPGEAAKLYINSAPAHHTYPTKKVSKAEAEIVELGTPETANHRIINKLLVNSVLPTCQLQMGMTELKSGSVWNTMPAHTHDRRMEAYFYFEVRKGRVFVTLWASHKKPVISGCRAIRR